MTGTTPLRATSAHAGVEGLHIGVHGLGNAFKLCGGWADEVLPELKATLSTGEEAAQGVSFRLQGNHALVKEVKDQLTESLTADGVEPGASTSTSPSSSHPGPGPEPDPSPGPNHQPQP